MEDFQDKSESEKNSETIPGMICNIIDDGSAVQIDVKDYRLIFFSDASGQVTLRSEANMVKQSGDYEVPASVYEHALLAAKDVFSKGHNSPYLESNENILSPDQAQVEIDKIKAMLEKTDDQQLH